MTVVRWTHSARRDYRNIVEWLRDRNRAAAVRIANAIDHRLTILETVPRIGRMGRLEGTRELVIPRTPYVAIYQLDDGEDQIVVLRLLHSAQRWPPKRR
ncbi:MAG TPA: type II toxin-antitoxin system RelE/ParE family toxin [Stellaceae bacterium]|nr:type II toxin-antitoxin system RelE/ParE family toxin [Stellaceae bacterium]